MILHQAALIIIVVGCLVCLFIAGLTPRIPDAPKKQLKAPDPNQDLYDEIEAASALHEREQDT